MKIKLRNINNIEKLFLLMIVFITIAPNTIIGYIGMISFMSYILVESVKSKIHFNVFLFLEMGFPIYLIFQLVVMNLYSKPAQFSGIKTLIITIIFNICIYNFIIKYGIDVAADDYSMGVILGTFIIALLYGKSIFIEGGLSANEFIGFSIFKIGGIAAVNIGWLNAIGIVLLWQKYLKKKDKNTLHKTIIMLIFVLLTGRRKILLFLISSLLAGTYFYNTKQGIVKSIKTVFKTILLIMVAYILLIYIPILYNFIGQRLVYAVDYILGNGVNFDSSINMRNQLVVLALKAWEKSPIWGQGYNSFTAIYNPNGYYTHNNMLELLVTGGLVGLILYYLPYAYLTLRLIYKCVKNLQYRWIYLYWLLNLIVFVALEYYQITYIYRSLTIFLVYIAAICSKKYDISK